jgi:hypothetical protein
MPIATFVGAAGLSAFKLPAGATIASVKVDGATATYTVDVNGKITVTAPAVTATSVLAVDYSAQLMAAWRGKRGVAPAAQDVLYTTMSKTEIKQAIEKLGTGPDPLAPWGFGRKILLEAGLFLVGTMSISSGTSLAAPAVGDSVLYFSDHAIVTADTAVIKVADDKKQKRSIPGRGVYENLVIDGADSDAAHAFNVHGILAEASADGLAPTIYDTLVSNCKGSGVKITGRDQMVTHRLKATSCSGYAMELHDVSDGKHFAPGLSGALGALLLEHCGTPKIYGGDMWLPSGFTGYFTVTLKNQGRALFDGTEISGRVGILGRGTQAANKYEMASNRFQNVNFKIDPNLPRTFTYTRDDLSTVSVSATIYAEDTDGTVINGCTLQYNDNTPTAADLTATPDYFIQIVTTKTGASNIAKYPGAVRMVGMHGLVHNRGRLADTAPVLCFKKHITNRPELLEWDFDPGAEVLMPYDPANPPRNYVPLGPFGGAAAVYNKADYPIGYLWNTPGGTLDDANTTFTLRVEPAAPPSGYRYCKRVWP